MKLVQCGLSFSASIKIIVLFRDFFENFSRNFILHYRSVRSFVHVPEKQSHTVGQRL